MSEVPAPATTSVLPAPQNRVALRLSALWVVRVAGAFAVGGALVTCSWLVLAATERPSVLSGTAREAGFAPWIVGPLGHLMPGLTHDPTRLRRDLTVALCCLMVCWVVAVLAAPRLPVWFVAGALGLLGVLLFLSPPLSLTDLFNYLHYGGMSSVHGLNPYADLPSAARNDPSWRLSNWHHLLSPYGPLFTLATSLLALLPLHAAYWTWKALVMLSAWGVLGVVAWTAPAVGRSRSRALALVGLNPLVLVYGLGGHHNEPLMLLSVVGAVALVVHAHTAPKPAPWSAGAGVAAVAGAGLKLSSVVLAPLIVLGAPRRRAALGGAVVATAMTAAVVVLVFAGRLPATGVQDQLVSPLSVPQVVGWLAGVGGETATIRTVCHLLLALSVIAAGVVVARDRSRLPGACGVVMLVAVLTLGWTMPWYVWWVLPFAALARTRWLAIACVVLTLWLGLGAIPQMPQLIHGLGYYPSRSPVGREHHRMTERLLR